MARVKSPYDEPREVPWLERIDEHPVQPGEVVDVPEEMLASFVEAGWYPADGETRDRALALLDEGTVSAVATEHVEEAKAAKMAARAAKSGAEGSAK